MPNPDFFSIDRVARYFDSQEFKYLTDNDGDIHINFEGNEFLVMSAGEMREILAIRGQWREVVPIEARGQLLEFANRWHSEKLFPKIDIQMTEEGKIAVGAEVNVDLEHGVTDGQLELLVDCGINTALAVFAELGKIALTEAGERKRSFWNR